MMLGTLDPTLSDVLDGLDGPGGEYLIYSKNLKYTVLLSFWRFCNAEKTNSP